MVTEKWKNFIEIYKGTVGLRRERYEATEAKYRQLYGSRAYMNYRVFQAAYNIHIDNQTIHVNTATKR